MKLFAKDTLFRCGVGLGNIWRGKAKQKSVVTYEIQWTADCGLFSLVVELYKEELPLEVG